MTTILIQPPPVEVQPPMIEVPRGDYCNSAIHGNCKIIIYRSGTGDDWDDYECGMNGKPLDWKNDFNTLLIFKCPACLAACAEAEKKEKGK